MLRFAADENFNNDILRGMRRREPDLDIVRVQDVGLSGVDDPSILLWAVEEGRVLLTHDVNTITQYASSGLKQVRMPTAVFEVSLRAPLGQGIDAHNLTLLGLEKEWKNRMGYVPLPAL